MEFGGLSRCGDEQARSTVRALTLFALSNLYLVRRLLMPRAERCVQRGQKACAEVEKRVGRRTKRHRRCRFDPATQQFSSRGSFHDWLRRASLGRSGPCISPHPTGGRAAFDELPLVARRGTVLKTTKIIPELAELSGFGGYEITK